MAGSSESSGASLARRGSILPPGRQPATAADMKIGPLIEIGVVVSDLSAAARTFANLLDLPVSTLIPAPMFSMNFRMCRLGQLDFELMQSNAADSIIARYLSRRGEGLHHVAFQVPDIDQAMAACRARGLSFTSEEPVLLGDLRAAFLHPGCMSGLLVEFVENLHNWGPADGGSRQDIGRVTGLGVVVEDVDAAAADFANGLGAIVSAPLRTAAFGARSRFVTVGDIRFEFIPSSAPAQEAAFSAVKPPGLHHVCLEVSDPVALARLRALSLPAGPGDREDTFLTEPSACHGVRFEVRPA